MYKKNAQQKTVIDACLYPSGDLDILSREEVLRLRDASNGQLHEQLRQCALAVIASGASLEDRREYKQLYADFNIDVSQCGQGVRVDLIHAPACAFVDGKIIKGIAELLFAVLRDLSYMAGRLSGINQHDLTGAEMTGLVFEQLRKAAILHKAQPNLVVCWGGHAISREEYLYTKRVGYHLGLRGLDICTGCGAGAMKGPMKGATIAHAKQRKKNSRYIGISELGIITSESPNPIVNHLVIFPDIEKRLEAFVRIGHGIVIFPGGVGTAEEILYILGILMNSANQVLPFPLILTGPSCAKAYFEKIQELILLTLGYEATKKYRIIIDDPITVAQEMVKGIEQVTQHRRKIQDPYYFNWAVTIPENFQRPYNITHESMSQLYLSRKREASDLAADLRRAFSGIVTGNIKEYARQKIAEYGPFQIRGEKAIMQAFDELLKTFIQQGRMKVTADYLPCYQILE